MHVKKKVQISTYLIVFLMVFTVTPNTIFAHSNLEKSFPSSNAKLKESPVSIEAWFEDPIVVHPESIQVFNSRGDKIGIKSTAIDRSNNKHIIGELSQPLGKASYTVKINVIALDGDVITEEYPFQVQGVASKEEQKSKFAIVKQFPKDGEITSGSPKRIELWFNEPATVTAVGVFDDQQQVVPLGQPEVDPNDPTHIRVNVEKKLEKGSYQVTWYARPVDAKEDQTDNLDVFYFAVDEYSSIKQESRAMSDGELWFQNMGIKQTSYFLIFLGIMVLFGGTFLHVIGGYNNSKRWRIATFIFVPLMLLGEILLIRSQLTELTNLSIIQLLSIKFIWMPIVQMGIAIMGLLFKKYNLYFYGLALLLIPFFIGHASYPRYGGFVTVLLNGIHLLAASIWIGGILALLISLGKVQEEWTKRAALLFSRCAFISLFVIIITGIWMTLSYLPSITFQSLWNSEWGRSLLFKTLFTVIIFVIGFLQRNTIRQYTFSRIKPFIIGLRSEVIIGSLILLFASFLVVSVPNDSNGIYLIEGVNHPIKTELDRLEPGVNELSVEFKENKIKKVEVTFEMPPNYKVTYKAFKVKDNIFKVTGNLIHAPGTTYIRIRAIIHDNKELKYRYKVLVPGEMNE
jgi:copper transport protein